MSSERRGHVPKTASEWANYHRSLEPGRQGPIDETTPFDSGDLDFTDETAREPQQGSPSLDAPFRKDPEESLATRIREGIENNIGPVALAGLVGLLAWILLELYGLTSQVARIETRAFDGVDGQLRTFEERIERSEEASRRFEERHLRHLEGHAEDRERAIRGEEQLRQLQRDAERATRHDRTPLNSDGDS